MTKTCEVCGQSFEPNKYRPKQRFCSPQCRLKWESQHQYNPKIYTCQHCGKEYAPKVANRDMYCSRECYQAHGRRGITPVFVFVCKVCGAHVERYGGYCSDECRKEVARRKAQERERREYKPRQHKCKECGVFFTTSYGDSRRSFCSDKCMKKYGRRVSGARRSARIRGAGYVETIDPMAVFRRDRWRCHLCGKRTPKRLRGTTEDRAPELDHVIPIARGGPHTYDNVACSCRRCNQAKGDRIVGQLGLLSSTADARGYAK